MSKNLEVQKAARLIHVRAAYVRHFVGLTLTFSFVRAEQVAHACVLALHFSAGQKLHPLLGARVGLLCHGFLCI